MKGLEISEVRLSSIQSDVETMRLDSEYHLKEFEKIDDFKKLNKHRFVKFSDFDLTIDCSAFYPGIEHLYGCGSNPLIRVQNVKSVIDYESCERLPELSDEFKTLKWVRKGDIVITKGGSIGYAGYVTEDALASRDLIFIKSSILDEKISKFLYLYFSTDFAFKQLIRSSSQCAQPHLTITLVKNFDILKPNMRIVNDSSMLYDKSMNCLKKSKQLYSEAESLLLSELGLKDWQPKNDNVSIKSFSDFNKTGRLDAEYYQNKYDELFDVVSRNAKSMKKISEIQKYNARGLQPEYVDGGKLAVINSKHILETGLDYDNFESTDISFWNNERSRVFKNDILVYTTGANIGRTAVYLKDEKAIASNHVNILRINVPNSIYVGFVMNSLIGRMQTEKLSAGSAQQELYPKDIENFFIPFVDEEIQHQISSKIQESFALQSESKRLLEEAKMLVEREIEK